jgi:release factor glutamine methyltransferase
MREMGGARREAAIAGMTSQPVPVGTAPAAAGRRTVVDALDHLRMALQAAGISAPGREARQILAASLGLPVSRVWPDRARVIGEEAWSRMTGRLARRAAGVPLAYVTGVAGFRTLDLVVDPRVLIPRPETEGLVELVLTWARTMKGGGLWGAALDVGTGSGCIALALAVEGRFDRIFATDRSRDAITLAGENLARVRPATPVTLAVGDLFRPIARSRFDVVVSNPPYVTPEEFEALDAGVTAHEPADALVSPDGGMAHTVSILDGARAVLRRGGLLAIEVDSRRAPDARDAAARLGWHAPHIVRDWFGRERYLLAEWR